MGYIVTQKHQVNIPTSCGLCHPPDRMGANLLLHQLGFQTSSAECDRCLKNQSNEALQFWYPLSSELLNHTSNCTLPKCPQEHIMWLAIQLPPLFSYCVDHFQLSQDTYTRLSLSYVHCFCAVQKETLHQSFNLFY